jgi:predicted phosphodiesterase
MLKKNSFYNLDFIYIKGNFEFMGEVDIKNTKYYQFECDNYNVYLTHGQLLKALENQTNPENPTGTPINDT